MITVGGCLANRNRRVSPPRIADQLLVDDLDDLLRGVQRLADLGAARPLLDRGDEVLDHGQRDVRLEQGEPDLARGGVDVGVGELPLAAEVLEGVGEAIRERGEHVWGSSGAGGQDQSPRVAALGG